MRTERGHRSTGRRTAGSALLLLGGLVAMVAAPGVSGAVNNNPVGNPTSPAVSYETDCTTSLQANQVAPFVVQLDANTSVDTALPTGATFGLSGTASLVMTGKFIAGIENAGAGITPWTMNWTETIGSTDGNATGSYTYVSPHISVANPGATVAKVSWASGSTMLTGNFSKAAVGDAVASSAAGLPVDATITSITAKTSATISVPTTAAATSQPVSFAATLTFSDPTFNTGPVFTTAGAGGGTAGVGVTGVTSVNVGAAIGVLFGGSTGDGPANCLETGYAGETVGSPAGPAQTGGASPPWATAPSLAVGSTTALVSASPLRFPAAAYVDLQGPPTAPTGVSATAGPTTAMVTWSAPASDGGSPVTGYTITPFIGATAQAPIAVGNVASHLVTGLTDGTAYTFTVTASNANGTSPASTPSNAVTPATVPGVPTSLVATAGNASAALTWSAPATDGGSPVTGYTITPYIGATAQAPIAVGSLVANQVTGLTNGTAYTFTVTATNSVGSGAASAASNAVTPSNAVVPPGFPTGVSATAGDSAASVTWSAPASDGGAPVTGYTVTPYIGATAQAPIPVGTVLTTSVTGLTNGTTYTFIVTATNSAGTGAASAPSNAVTPATVPGVPRGVAATAGDASALVEWSAPLSDGGAPVSGYTITPYIGVTAQAPVSVGNVVSATVTGLTNGTAYTFVVTATNAVGTGPASTPSTPVTPLTVPGAPTGLSIVHVGDASVQLQWTGPASTGGSPVTGYAITPYIGATAQTSVVVGNVTVATVTGLTDGTVYTFTVSAANSVGVGPASGPSAPVTPATVPDAPTGVSATGGDTTAALTWSAPGSDGGTAITGYTVVPYVGGLAQAPIPVGPVLTYVVTGLTDGVSYTFTVAATNAMGTGPASAASDAVIPAVVYVPGYWMVTADGSVFAQGSVGLLGSPDAFVLRSPIAGMAPAADNTGYWIAGADGGVFNYGSAGFYGGHGGSPLNSPIVGIAPTADGQGYWLAGADGGVFAYGDATYAGSHGGSPLNSPIVGISATPDGRGYWLVAADGGVFAYGDATFFGSHGASPLNSPIVGIAPTADGRGYWLVAADGGVFAYGDATFFGSHGASPLDSPVVGIVAGAGGGYVLVAADGGAFAYGTTFYGSQGGTALASPVVAAG